MKINIIKQLAAIAIVGALFTSCNKDKVEPLDDRGQTLIRILDGGRTDSVGHKLFALDFVNIPTTLLIADIRRDASNQAELNKTVTVVVKDDTAALHAYGLTTLDPSWYSFSPGVVKTGGDGGVYTFTFAPGEFAKTISITIPDATVLDPSESYGLAFSITSATEGNISINRVLIVEIGAKNIYDGVYRLTGTFTHPTADYVGPFGTPGRGAPLEVALVTTGANTVSRLGVTPDDVADFDGFIFWTTAGASLTGFSNVFPEYSVDPTTNVVTVYSNHPDNTVTWINYNSRYDPATRTFDMDYGYNTADRRIRETWTYVRSR